MQRSLLSRLATLLAKLENLLGQKHRSMIYPSSSHGLRSIFGHVDFLGQGATTLQEDVRPPFANTSHIFIISIQVHFAGRIRTDLPDLRFFVLSDVWLDVPETFIGLRKMFDNCIESNFIPKVIVMCGDFTSKGIAQGTGKDIRKYQGMVHTSSIL